MIKPNSYADIIDAAYIRLLFALLASSRAPDQYDAILDYYLFDDKRPKRYEDLPYVCIPKGKLFKLAFQF